MKRDKQLNPAPAELPAYRGVTGQAEGIGKMAELSTEFFTDILEGNRSAVKAAVTDALMSGIKRQFEWELPNAVKEEVSKFVTDQIVPEVRAQLLANKDDLVDAAIVMVRGIPAELSKAMQEQLAKNLTQSWTLNKIIEACFK